MPTLPEIESAFVKADAAGNAEDAAVFAAEIKRLREATPAEPPLSKMTVEGFKKAEAAKPKGRSAAGILADVGLEGGGAFAGQIIGAHPLLSVPTFGASIPILGAVGGATGNIAAQRRRISAGEQDKFKWGEFAGMTLASAVPGSPEALGAAALLKAGGKQAAAGLAAKVVETTIDEGRLPGTGEVLTSALVPAGGGMLAQRMGTAGADALNPTKRATLEAGKEAGLVVIPSSVSDSAINRRLEGLVGVPRVKQAASLKNQPRTTELAKKELGIRDGDDITEELLEGIRKQESAPYSEIQSMATKATKELDDVQRATMGLNAHDTAALRASPDVADRIKTLTVQAGADINALRDARLAAKEGFKEYGRTADRKALDAARASDQLATELENKIELAAEQFGSAGLLDRLRASREKIAKTWDVENALNTGDAEISAEILARLSKKGRPLSGNLETIAEFTKAFPQVMKEGAKVPPISGTAVESGYALAALASGHPILAASLLARGPTRSLLLSKPYQALATAAPFAMPNAAVATRVLAQTAGQELAPEPRKKSQ